MPTPDPYEEEYHDYCSPLQRAIYERNMFQDEHDRRKEQIEKEMVERFEDNKVPMKVEITTNHDVSSTCHGLMTVPMLEFLNGRPWCDEIRSFISSLRPSSVRICKNSAHLNCSLWRVTVWLNPDDTVRSIEQEVQCSLFGEKDEHGFTKHCGGDLVQWALHNNTFVNVTKKHRKHGQ